MTNNKIILELIKKDIEELRLLFEVFENSHERESALIDIAISKTQNLIHEISLLKKENQFEQPFSKNIEKAKEAPEKIFHSSYIEEKKEKSTKTNREEPVSRNVEVSKTEEENDEATLQMKQKAELPIEKVATPIPPAEEGTVQSAKKEDEEGLDESVDKANSALPITSDEGSADREQSNEEKPHLLLGEKFTKEPTLNERFASLSDYKIKGKPITSIKSAIGLNDRFMYTRELFENDREKFEDTVETLDKATGLVEAIEYLEQNFKWQKTDISLKFMELIKRRFEE